MVYAFIIYILSHIAFMPVTGTYYYSGTVTASGLAYTQEQSESHLFLATSQDIPMWRKANIGIQDVVLLIGPSLWCGLKFNKDRMPNQWHHRVDIRVEKGYKGQGKCQAGLFYWKNKK